MSERYEAVRLREGFLEHGFHGGGELTAIDEDYAGYVSRCLQGGLQDDSTSHAVADQHGGRQGECPHEFRDISDVPLMVRSAAVPGLAPMPVQKIDGDRSVTTGRPAKAP